MKPLTTLLPVILMSGLALAGFSSVASAGFDPSPFQPEINQLGAAQNILESIHHKTDATLDNPPIEGMPSPNLNGAVNRLESIDKQVNNVAGFISSTVEAVLGLEPIPFRVDVIPALEGVRDTAQGIVLSIDAFLGSPPDPYIPVEFINALGGLLGSTESLVTQTTQYIDQLGAECTFPCIEHTAQAGCELINCVWHDVPGASGYCCNW